MDEAQVVNEKELKKAFKPKNTKLKISIITFVVGILALMAGVVFVLLNTLKGPGIRDAEYLVQIGAWQRRDDSAVVWNFTEVGKGQLTTNFHVNDYDFIWRIDEDRLKIETEWLYDINNEFTYKLDQDNQILTLSDGSSNIDFVPASSIDAEI